MGTSKSLKLNLPWKFRILLHLLSFISLLPNNTITLTRFIINLFDLKIPPSIEPDNGVFTFDTIVDPSRNLWFRFFVPSSNNNNNNIPRPIIIYFHGGGFALFSPNSLPFDHLCRSLSRDIHAVIVSVNYRLSPEHKFPSQYDDGFDALKFLDQMDMEYDFSNCFIAGDSAGANLAHHVVVRVSSYDFKKVKIKGLISIQPFFGGEERTESEIEFERSPILSLKVADWYWRAFLPDGCDKNHAAARVFGLGDDVETISSVEFPATLLIIGGMDTLRDWGRKYYEWLKREGKEVELVEYPNAIHGFYVVPELQDVSLMIKDVKDFIHKQSAV